MDLNVIIPNYNNFLDNFINFLVLNYLPDNNFLFQIDNFPVNINNFYKDEFSNLMYRNFTTFNHGFQNNNFFNNEDLNFIINRFTDFLDTGNHVYFKIFIYYLFDKLIKTGKNIFIGNYIKKLFLRNFNDTNLIIYSQQIDNEIGFQINNDINLQNFFNGIDIKYNRLLRIIIFINIIELIEKLNPKYNIYFFIQLSIRQLFINFNNNTSFLSNNNRKLIVNNMDTIQEINRKYSYNKFNILTQDIKINMLNNFNFDKRFFDIKLAKLNDDNITSIIKNINKSRTINEYIANFDILYRQREAQDLNQKLSNKILTINNFFHPNPQQDFVFYIDWLLNLAVSLNNQAAYDKIKRYFRYFIQNVNNTFQQDRQILQQNGEHLIQNETHEFGVVIEKITDNPLLNINLDNLTRIDNEFSKIKETIEESKKTIFVHDIKDLIDQYRKVENFKNDEDENSIPKKFFDTLWNEFNKPLNNYQVQNINNNNIDQMEIDSDDLLQSTFDLSQYEFHIRRNFVLEFLYKNFFRFDPRTYSNLFNEVDEIKVVFANDNPLILGCLSAAYFQHPDYIDGTNFDFLLEKGLKTEEINECFINYERLYNLYLFRNPGQIMQPNPVDPYEMKYIYNLKKLNNLNNLIINNQPLNFNNRFSKIIKETVNSFQGNYDEIISYSIFTSLFSDNLKTHLHHLKNKNENQAGIFDINAYYDKFILPAYTLGNNPNLVYFDKISRNQNVDEIVCQSYLDLLYYNYDYALQLPAPNPQRNDFQQTCEDILYLKSKYIKYCYSEYSDEYHGKLKIKFDHLVLTEDIINSINNDDDNNISIKIDNKSIRKKTRQRARGRQQQKLFELSYNEKVIKIRNNFGLIRDDEIDTFDKALCNILMRMFYFWCIIPVRSYEYDFVNNFNNIFTFNLNPDPHFLNLEKLFNTCKTRREFKIINKLISMIYNKNYDEQVIDDLLNFYNIDKNKDDASLLDEVYEKTMNFQPVFNNTNNETNFYFLPFRRNEFSLFYKSTYHPNKTNISFYHSIFSEYKLTEFFPLLVLYTNFGQMNNNNRFVTKYLINGQNPQSLGNMNNFNFGNYINLFRLSFDNYFNDKIIETNNNKIFNLFKNFILFNYLFKSQNPYLPSIIYNNNKVKYNYPNIYDTGSYIDGSYRFFRNKENMFYNYPFCNVNKRFINFPVTLQNTRDEFPFEFNGNYQSVNTLRNMSIQNRQQLIVDYKNHIVGLLNGNIDDTNYQRNLQRILNYNQINTPIYNEINNYLIPFYHAGQLFEDFINYINENINNINIIPKINTNFYTVPSIKQAIISNKIPINSLIDLTKTVLLNFLLINLEQIKLKTSNNKDILDYLHGSGDSKVDINKLNIDDSIKKYIENKIKNTKNILDINKFVNDIISDPLLNDKLI